jgi:hypothetical protein
MSTSTQSYIPICFRKISKMIIYKNYNPFSDKFNKWNLAIRYYNPHYEKRPTYRKHILIPSDQYVLIDESVEILNFNTEDNAILHKNKLSIYCEKCHQYQISANCCHLRSN